MMYRTTKKSQGNGFTLVETLVAIAVLMIAITGPFYMLQQAIKASYAARDQLIASSLSQEGVEYVYFVRNSNYLSSRSWLDGMSTCASSQGCTVDSVSGFAPCGSGGCAPVRLTLAGMYTQAGQGSVTKFTRTVRVQQVSAIQARVTVNISWKSNYGSYSIDITEDLYNWL